MAEPDFPAEVDRQSARRSRLWRRLCLIAILCVGAGAGIYRVWTGNRARMLTELTAEFGQSYGSEFRASDSSVSCRGVTITDELARSIASARSVSSLQLTSCRISNDGWNAVTSLPNLTDLSVLDCQFTEPGKIRFGDSQSLVRVGIRNTKLAGSNLAEFLSQQPHLEALVLELTRIADDDLKSWTAPAELNQVAIREQMLTAAGMAGLARCRRLESLLLASTGIDDKGLALVAAQPSLKNLDLTMCPAFDGTGLARLAPLTDLANLNLTSTQVTDKGLESLAAGFSALSQVRLQNCGRITDAVFQSLARLPRLKMLDLSKTKVTGRGLKYLSGHKCLGTLMLNDTDLDDEGLSTLGAMPALAMLDLSHTRISGGTLARLNDCPRLESLSIAGCSVSRQAVASLRSAAPSLRRLDCSDCAAVDDETIETLASSKHLQVIECRGTRVFDRWNTSVVVRPGSNGLSTVLSHAEIDDAAARDLNASGRLSGLSFDHCRLSPGALNIATSSPALRRLGLVDCAILGGKPGHLGPLERLEELTIRNTMIDVADVVRISKGRRLGGLVLEGSPTNSGAFLGWSGASLVQKFEFKGVGDGGHNLKGRQDSVAQWTLDLSDSGATDAALETVRGLNGLGTINLAGCKQVTDRGLLLLSGMSRLQSLNLSGTGVTDRGLEALSQIPRLQKLDLSKTNLDGHGLTYLKQQKFLTELNLTAAKLTDSGLAGVAFPPSLSGLTLVNTAISGTGLAGLGKVSRLWSLNLGRSNVDDEGLKTIAAIPFLGQLDLSHCAKISDVGVRQIAKLSRLAALDLQATQTSDAALAAIATMPKLERLNLRETLVTARGVEQLLSCPRLQTLQADEGSVPRALVSQFNHSRVAPISPK
jgi:Leucine Rich repeat